MLDQNLWSVYILFFGEGGKRCEEPVKQAAQVYSGETISFLHRCKKEEHNVPLYFIILRGILPFLTRDRYTPFQESSDLSDNCFPVQLLH